MDYMTSFKTKCSEFLLAETGTSAFWGMELYFLSSCQKSTRPFCHTEHLMIWGSLYEIGLATLHSEQVPVWYKILARIFSPLWCLVFAVFGKPGSKIMMKIHGVPMLFVLTLFNPLHKLLDQFEVPYLAFLFALLKVIMLLLTCFSSEFSCNDHRTISFSLSVSTVLKIFFLFLLQPFDWIKKTFFEKPEPEAWVLMGVHGCNFWCVHFQDDSEFGWPSQ